MHCAASMARNRHSHSKGYPCASVLHLRRFDLVKGGQPDGQEEQLLLRSFKHVHHEHFVGAIVVAARCKCSAGCFPVDQN